MGYRYNISTADAFEDLKYYPEVTAAGIPQIQLALNSLQAGRTFQVDKQPLYVNAFLMKI